MLVKNSMMFMLCALVTMLFTSGCSMGPEDTNPQSPKSQADKAPKVERTTLKINLNPKPGSTLSERRPCIEVNFSRTPLLTEGTPKVHWKQEGQGTAKVLELEEYQTGKWRFCSYLYLNKGKHEIQVKVKEADKSYSKTATYQSVAKAKPGDITVEKAQVTHLRLEEAYSPSALLKNSLFKSVKKDAFFLPLLAQVLDKTGHQNGRLSLLVGLGQLPGNTQYSAKNIRLDNQKTPVSLKLDGQYQGRTFRVKYSKDFLLPTSTFGMLHFHSFELTGSFTKDGKNIQEATFHAEIDAESQKLTGFCGMKGVPCYQGNDGKQKMVLAGKFAGKTNTHSFATYITQPTLYQANFAKQTIEFYTNETIQAKQVKVAFWICTGSTNKENPCDVKKGAKLQKVKIPGLLSLSPENRKGSFEPETLQANTWYKAEFTVSNTKGATYKTFTIFSKE